eukprot:3310813-Pyramimonas_sp.AAC.2
MEKSAQLKTALQSSIETAEQHMTGLLADRAKLESLIQMKQQACEAQGVGLALWQIRVTQGMLT